MSKQILMETLAKFQRGKSGNSNHTFSRVALEAKQSSWLQRIVAMIGVIAQGLGELAAAYSAEISLTLKSRVDHLRCHAGFPKALIVRTASPKFGIGSVMLVLASPLHLSELFTNSLSFPSLQKVVLSRRYSLTTGSVLYA